MAAVANQAAKSGASEATILAVERTRLAHERTLMAWVRTATSLITFGFTLYKFAQYLLEKREEPRQHLFDTRHFAGLMIVIGLVALVLATIKHIRDIEDLRRLHPEVPYSLAAVLGALIAILGIGALIAVIFRL